MLLFVFITVVGWLLYQYTDGNLKILKPMEDYFILFLLLHYFQYVHYLCPGMSADKITCSSEFLSYFY